MAKANYMTLSRTPGDITLTLHDVKLILRVFEGALKNNENITTFTGFNIRDTNASMQSHLQALTIPDNPHDNSLESFSMTPRSVTPSNVFGNMNNPLDTVQNSQN